jgi:glycosyltransferase involved in cell wall biosynthesis
MPDLRLVIGGDGDARYIESLHQEVKKLKIDKAVVWAGFMDAQVRLEALAAADVFCLPSWSENFGVALLEAMAAGLPCVATDQVALAVDADTEKAVKLIRCNVQELEDSILELFGNETKRKELGERAAEYARKHHGMESAAKRLKALYESVS